MTAFYFFLLGTALGTIVGAALGLDMGGHRLTRRSDRRGSLEVVQLLPACTQRPAAWRRGKHKGTRV